METPKTGDEYWRSFPLDVKVEILVRLPIKQLMRLRCVSKSWCLMTDGSDFINAHLSLSKTRPRFDHWFVVIDEDRCKAKYLANDNELVFDRKVRAMAIVGCCNGIVCIAVSIDEKCRYYLWNPSTRESKLLPIGRGGIGGLYHCSYGFGFEVSNTEYKIICTSQSGLFGGRTSRVYGSRSKSWRTLDSQGDVGCLSNGQGSFFKGKLYWFRTNDGPYSRRKGNMVNLVWFDLGSEGWGSMPCPRWGDEGGKDTDGTLWVLGGDTCLRVICENKVVGDYDVWAWNEIGKSWERRLTIGGLISLNLM